LTISPTGWFEYRRSIPKNLRELFPRSKTGKIKSEWKAALKTKSPTIAQQLWVNENQQYEKVQAAAEYLRNNTEFQSTEDSIATAKQVAIRYGVHPEQAPKLDVNATHAEIAEFPQKISEWKRLVCEHEELLLSLIYENTGPVALSCRPKCSFKPPSVRKRQGFSSPMLSGVGADCRTRLCIRRLPSQPSCGFPMYRARSIPL